MPKKIVLAYSGGLDTSVILKWLQVKYQCPVVTFTADLGQGEELSPVKGKAQSLGVEEIFIEDLREEFVKKESLKNLHKERKKHASELQKNVGSSKRKSSAGRLSSVYIFF